ncbi:MAG: baseplate assembly protein [Sphingobium sp.]|nr:baseplate assembly protein [Sphingobium sp.]
MADTFTAVDLSRLPAPDLVETLDYEAILAANIAAMRILIPDFVARESDPATVALQVFSYREMLLRQRVNDAAKAVMVAYAMGGDLDNLGALFGVARLLITPADTQAGTPDIWESDEDFRRRIVMAPEGYSVAGPEGAYIFHALSADSRVLDASAISNNPGEVLVTILGREGDGTAPAALLTAVYDYLSAETRRPLTDLVIVQSATITPFAVEAEITTYSGPDAGLVLAESRRKLDEYLTTSRRLGRDITLSAIHSALHGDGVHNVRIINPPADIIIDPTGCASCTATDVRHIGTGE